MDYTRSTLRQYLAAQCRGRNGLDQDLAALIEDVAASCKAIAGAVERAALEGRLGNVDGEVLNVQGETQKKLDVLANDLMIEAGLRGGHIAGLASEEMAEVLPVPENQTRGDYLLLFDPLDGSGNVDVNLTVGSIFSVLRRPHAARALAPAEFLQPGDEQVAAGFALYGPATVLVLTTGRGVDGFTLDRQSGEFVLTQVQMTVPKDTAEYAINGANERFWEAPVRRYIDECRAGRAGLRAKDFNTRWIASLVAEAYRVLTRGGVYLYPIDERLRPLGGRLRLLYEVNPVAFLIEQAGGSASTGRMRVLEVEPESLHQRVPCIFGACHEVERLNQYHREYREGRDSRELASPLFGERSLLRA